MSWHSVAAAPNANGFPIHTVTLTYKHTHSTTLLKKNTCFSTYSFLFGTQCEKKHSFSLPCCFFVLSLTSSDCYKSALSIIISLKTPQKQYLCAEIRFIRIRRLISIYRTLSFILSLSQTVHSLLSLRKAKLFHSSHLSFNSIFYH